MNATDFKNAFKKLKEEKKQISEKAGDKKYIKYSDIIEEKLLGNKTAEPLLRNFKEIEDERDQYNKKRNEELKRKLQEKTEYQDNKEVDNNISSNDKEKEEDNNNEATNIEVPKDFNLELNKKEYIVNIDPKE